jgi:hypothetical protein
MPTINRTKAIKPAPVVGYDLHVCRAYQLIAGGYSERSAAARLAFEMRTTPADVAEAVSHAAECHRALSGLLGRSNGPKVGARKVA